MIGRQTIPDQDALRRVGEAVRQRLDANPEAYKVPVDQAEIYAIGDFFDADECARMVTMIDSVAKPSELYDGASHLPNFRTSYSGNFDRSDEFVQSVSGRIDTLLGVKPACGETIQGQRYFPGQEFKPHNDWFYPDQPHWKVESKRGGQRSWTAMIFLNEVEQGGETHFTQVGIKLEPKPGVIIVWNNATPEGLPNEDTIHAGTPVIKGAKYVLTKWYRTRKWT